MTDGTKVKLNISLILLHGSIMILSVNLYHTFRYVFFFPHLVFFRFSFHGSFLLFNQFPLMEYANVCPVFHLCENKIECSKSVS